MSKPKVKKPRQFSLQLGKLKVELNYALSDANRPPSLGVVARPGQAGVTVGYSEWNTDKAISEGYVSSSFVFMCLNIIVKNMAQAKWKIRIKQTDGTYKDSLVHPANKFIKTPNPEMNFTTFLEHVVLNSFLGGNWVAEKVKLTGQEYDWWLLALNNIRPIRDTEGYLSHYDYLPDPKVPKAVRKEIVDLIHGQGTTNPADHYWGLSILRPLRKAIDTANAAADFNKETLAKFGIIDGILSTEKILEPEEYEFAKQKAQEEWGSRRNSIAVLGSGLLYQNIARSPQEMDFMNTLKQLMSEIAGAFGVPLPLLGNMDASTYNNVSAMMNFLWTYTIKPILDRFVETVNTDFAKTFGEGVEIDYDLSEVDALRDDEVKRTDIMVKKVDTVIKLKTNSITVAEAKIIIDELANL